MPNCFKNKIRYMFTKNKAHEFNVRMLIYQNGNLWPSMPLTNKQHYIQLIHHHMHGGVSI